MKPTNLKYSGSAYFYILTNYKKSLKIYSGLYWHYC